MTRDDHTLLAAHIAGDPEAFGELFAGTIREFLQGNSRQQFQ